MAGDQVPAFLTPEDTRRVEAAIRAAEARTSGEIRVHVEGRCGLFPLERGKRVFEKLGMAGTELRNGVLIYLAVVDRRFVILGDSAVDAVVPPGFWDEVRDAIQADFRAGRPADGLVAAVGRVGAVLSQHFPRRADDRNELSDAVSLG